MSETTSTKEKVTFEMVGAAAQDALKRSETLWSKMCLFVVSTLADAVKAAPENRKAMSEAFAEHETAYKAKHDNANLNAIGAYRSAKSIIGAAAHYRVPLVEKGKVRGKTEVEKAIKDVREKPSAVATVTRAFTMVDTKLDSGELTGNDWAIVYTQAKALFTKIEKMTAEKMKPAAAKQEKQEVAA